MMSAMVAPTPTPTPADPSPIETKAAAAPPPRKRRRRTTAGGATDDCFTCRNRALKCDRKRPYCTQCIDIGKECSGYKTTLTWGVGVASRGKLRGLACPVANKNVDGSDASPVGPGSRRRTNSVAKVKREDVTGNDGTNGTNRPPPATTTTTTTTQQQHQHQHQHQQPVARARPSPSPSLPMQSQQTTWQTTSFQEHVQSRPTNIARAASFSHPSLQRIQTSLPPHFDQVNMPVSGTSVASYADADFHTPMEYPRTPGSIVFSDHHIPQNPYADAAPLTASSVDSFNLNSNPMESYGHSMPSGLDPVQATMGFADAGSMGAANHDELTRFNNMLFDRPDMILPSFGDGSLEYIQFDGIVDDDDEHGGEAAGRKDMSLLDTRFSGPFFHVPPRLQTLMEYYDRHVCPYLVAFDGPDNPYRKHILQLAMRNEGLQNAIAALSTNNLRMRKKEPRPMIGFVEEITDAFDGGPSRGKEYSEPTPEESLYKQMSIDQLNMQLTDARSAQDDSVLATLLILCLFHVCDSGFSKFKTQLAGVQKLLSLRNPRTQSDFTGWVEMFFTWFDVMTSTVNDREMQIKGESLAMLDYSANLGALEQFSGCDGRLFKLIARLGRLSLLAQGRPVRRQTGDHTAQRPTDLGRPTMMKPPQHQQHHHQHQHQHNNHHHRKRRRSAGARAGVPSGIDYENLDGNGWGTPILSSDEDADGSADEAAAAATANATLPDERHAFWSEWHDVRGRLGAWRMDFSPSSPSPSSSSPAAAAASSSSSSSPDAHAHVQLDQGQRDLVHINESFRYSALLYTERLGHPLLPSSHQQFQQFVSQALYHITALPVTSCVNKFLLWPLFITGTECVDEGHRHIIRSRCVEVQKESGFFNNISSLEVLEKVWREVGSNVRGSEDAEVRARRRDSTSGPYGRYGQPFRWRKAMDRVDGEYIVI